MSRWIQTVGVLLPRLLACSGAVFVLSLAITAITQRCCNWYRTDDEVRVENLRKRYVPRKACLFPSYSFLHLDHTPLIYTSRSTHWMHKWARVTALWALSWGGMLISTRCGAIGGLSTTGGSQKAEAGWDPRAISSISSNSRAEFSDVFKEVRGLSKFADLQVERRNEEKSAGSWDTWQSYFILVHVISCHFMSFHCESNKTP